MPPKYVKAYVKHGKTDATAAICEEVTRPSMSFVPVKRLEQQGQSMLHSARSQPIGQRTQLINAVRAHLRSGPRGRGEQTAECAYRSGACRDWRKVKTVAWREANRERCRLFEVR